MIRISSRFIFAAFLSILFCAAPLTAQEGTPRIRLDRVLALGGDLGGADDTFVDVSDVATGPDGEIYVLDSGDKAVKVFSARGQFVRRFGREGGGPGEFQVPTSIRVDSLVRVSDLAQQRMAHFALDGRHVRTVRSPDMGERPLLSIVPLRNGRMIGNTPAAMTASSSGRTASPQVEVLVVDADGGSPDTLMRLHSGVSAFHPRDGNLPFGLFESHAGRGGAHAVLGDSLVATADGYSGQVRWYRADANGMTVVRTRQLPSQSRPVTQDDLRRMERDLRAGRRRDEQLPRRLAIEAPPRVSIATQALFATDGSLWIRNTAGKGHAHVWTVFDPRGEIAFRLSLPAGFELCHVRGDRLYGTARTENDAHVVHVYRLVRG